MSNANKSKQGKRETRRKLLARIVALIMALLMIGGSAYYLISMLIPQSYAMDSSFYGNSGMLADDLNIRVGLKYGSGVPDSFETTTTGGYTLGIQPLSDGVFDYTPFWQLNQTVLTVAADANLSRSGSAYYPTNSAYNVVIGGYHIEFWTEYTVETAVFLQQQITAMNTALYGSGYYAFPAYVNGVLRIRVGLFSSWDAAQAAYPSIAAYMPAFQATVTAPTSTGVVVIDPTADHIVFHYDDGGNTALGLSATPVGTSDAYMKTDAGNVYDGVFAYTRYADEDADGIAVTNVLTLDQYVEGVLPYEISNSWPIETQKACAIAARSFAASCLERHQRAYGFDLCNAAHCQAYLGAGRVNDKVKEAAQSTHGLIITHGGVVASTFYSSSCGGYTVNIGDVWGGSSYDYLVAHATPWEKYMECDGGFWIVEVSPTELLDYLVNTKGHSELAGGGYITNIEILAYSAGSPYVKTLRITAANGRSIILNNTDAVRLGLGRYLKSANFVVGKGSVSYTTDTVTVLDERIIDMAVVKNVLPPVSDSGAQQTSEGVISTGVQVSVLTSLSNFFTTLLNAPVLTASGYTSASSDKVFVLTANNASSFAAGNIVLPQDNGIAVPRTVKNYAVYTETRTATASSSQNFIFVGKGNGHGAGLSQYGSRDLGNLGYDYSQIINAYYTDVSIVFYKELEKFKNR